MSIFTDHPALRWTVPTAAVGVIGAASLVVNQTANADAGLPARTAQQLLADVRSSDVSSLSGTVVQTSDLGIPALPGLSGGAPSGLAGAGGGSLASLVSGTHTWRVWFDGPQRQRLALVGSSGESDVIRNGRDVWVWSSADRTAVHHRLDASAGSSGSTPRPTPSLPSGLPTTPDAAARTALATMGANTSVTTSGTASVAGRSAYELVLTPKDGTTRIASIRIAIDAQEHVPVRVQVYSTKLANPAFEVGFTAIDFARPDTRQFEFTAPPGTTVTESSGLTTPKGPGATNAPPKDPAAAARLAAQTKVVGSGWSTVVVAPMPTTQTAQSGSQSGTQSGSASGDLGRQLAGILKALPSVSGTWGSGHLLEGTLFSAVVTDDGRVAVGAVGPEQLYAALGAK